DSITSPKEDSPSCRKSTDGIKTKSGSTRGVCRMRNRFYARNAQEATPTDGIRSQAGMEGNLCRKSLRAQIR
ncbi:hypothetical protein, partial [Bilophila wadsworthia]|uniref:hypothetical protein n=1 Tax=Bilophila wadsworthia TaxID=35833 RepID=UPI003A87F277